MIPLAEELDTPHGMSKFPPITSWEARDNLPRVLGDSAIRRPQLQKRLRLYQRMRRRQTRDIFPERPLCFPEITNNPPVAKLATPPAFKAWAGQTINATFDASGSSDPDPGDTALLTYSWDFNNDGVFGNPKDGGTDIIPLKSTHQHLYRQSGFGESNRSKRRIEHRHRIGEHDMVHCPERQGHRRHRPERSTARPLYRSH